MPAETNKAVVARYLEEVWGKGNLDSIRQFLSPNYRRHQSPTLPPLDAEGQIERLAGLRRAFPDVEITIERLLAVGDLVAMQGTLRGTHLGELSGIAPTGRQVVVGIADVVRFEAGLFAEHWGGPDMADMRRQISVDD